MRQTTISSSKDRALARLSPDTRFSLLPRMGGPPTCKLSAHGCGGGGGSSGLRKTCWPRLRNWTTAMRMWCNTRTMLADTRPPRQPGRPAALGQPVRNSFAGPREGPPRSRPAPAPAPPQASRPRLRPCHQGQHLNVFRRSDPTRSQPTRPCQAVTLPRLLQRVGYGDPLSSVASPAFAALRFSHRHSSYLAEHLPESRALPHHILPITWTSAAQPEPKGRVQRSGGRGPRSQSRNPEVPSLLPVQKAEVEGEI